MKSIILQNQNNVSVNVNWILKFLKEETLNQLALIFHRNELIWKKKNLTAIARFKLTVIRN